MGWQMYSRTTIQGNKSAIEEIAKLISNAKELEERFPIVNVFGQPAVELQKDDGFIQVVFSTRKRIPEDLFAYCESLGCKVFAVSNHEDGDFYDTDMMSEIREEQLESLEKQLAEEKLALEECGSNSDGCVVGEGVVSEKALHGATVAVLEDQIAALREKIAADVWKQVLAEES